MIKELRSKLDNKEVTSEELFNDSVNKAKLENSKCNSYITIMDKYEHISSNSILDGIPYSLKDNYSTKGILTTGASNILRNYVPCFDSTVYKKLKESGAVLIGKTNLDELAMGGTSTTGCFGSVLNPLDITRQAGGSSGGSAATVTSKTVSFSIGSDTGDSVRKPASYCGIVGFKPTYGRISRYGLFPFASSLDHVGIFANNVYDAAVVTDILKGKDEKDMVTLDSENIEYHNNLETNLKGKKFFYIKEILDKEDYKDNENTIKVLDEFDKYIELLRNNGVIVEGVSIDKKLCNSIWAIYSIISRAEATSNNSNLTGFIFGNTSNGESPDEIMFNTRTNGFGEFIKRRFILGSYSLERENQELLFLNAKRARNMLVTKINEYFKEYDALLMPASGMIAPKLDVTTNDDNNTNRYGYSSIENHLAIGNFGGYPSITLPFIKIDNMPVGINITCEQKKDLECLQIANSLERLGE